MGDGVEVVEMDVPINPIVSEQYCSPIPVELTVSKNLESQLSGGIFEIKDSDDKVIFKMDGHTFSLQDKRVLLDAAGSPIICAVKTPIDMHDTWDIFRGDTSNDESKLFTVKKTSIVQFQTHLDVFLAGDSDKNFPDFAVKGNFFERQAHVSKGDKVIAELKRKFTVDNVLLDKHTFITVVYPGIDQAFIATLVVIMDVMHGD